MEDDQTALEDERAIELSSIQAIFPELTIDPNDPFRASLDLAVSPDKPLKTFFLAPAQSRSALDIEGTFGPNNVTIAPVVTHELLHLPPLRVNLSLPDGYPASQPPKIELSSNPSWIPKDCLATLSNACEHLWKDLGQDQVVYAYIDHLQQSAEAAFDLGVGADHRLKLPGDLKISLLDFDLSKRKEQFENSTFGCGICLEPKKGTHCHQLLFCQHVFCVSCLQDFYNNAITEGDVNSVKCLSPDCGKENAPQTPDAPRRRNHRTLNPSELLQIPIDLEKVQRYVELKRKKRLEADKNTIYCPRQWCQGPARSKKYPKPSDPLGDFVESDSEPEPVLEPEAVVDENSGKKKKKKVKDIPMSERLAVCEDCDFAFCSVCNNGWHGELAFCNPRRQAELDAEEKATLAYLNEYSRRCPTCNAPAQKTMGCNHMICSQCRTHFCYLCSAFLMPDNPYDHFNTFKSTCYMRLWELEQGDGYGAREGVPGEIANAEVLMEESDTESGSEEEDTDSSEDEEDEEDENVAAAGEGPIHAPDLQPEDRQQRHIEIINFAGNGGNQRIQLPDQAGPVIPPVVPDPPQLRGGNQHGNRRPADNAEPNRNPHGAGRGADVPRHQVAGGRIGGAAAAPRADALGRFLQLALNDQEDEWDSDELDDDDFNIPQPPSRNGRRIHR